MTLTLNGWHPGERTIRARLGLDQGPTAHAYTWIGGEMPEQHRVFYARNLAFLPLTTLDAEGRPWAGFAVNADQPGERRFVDSPRETQLVMRLTAPLGDPLIENLARVKSGDSEGLIAGLGIELSTRRRNKFAGRAVSVQNIGRRALQADLRVNEAIGNCPKYINVRDMQAYPNVQPEIAFKNLHLDATERLPEEAIRLIHNCDTLFFGTTYAASASDAPKFPSHVGMNARGGRPGFVRVLPSDARTLVIPDYSGNRIMTSLGNIEATPLAAASVWDFETGDVLYMTGSAKNLLGEDARKLMPRQNVLTTLHIDAFILVRNAMPLRQRPGSEVERSPYSPTVKLLAEEKPQWGSGEGSEEVSLTLVSIALHSPTLATFSFEASKAVPIRAGQAIAIDFTMLMGGQEYSHMAATGMEARLNDDRIRTWTVASVKSWPGKDIVVGRDADREGNRDLQRAQILNLTMREKQGGFITGALFSIARNLAEKMPAALRDSRPLGLKVSLSGVSGSFTLPVEISSQEQLKFLWLAGGVGFTPFLAMLRSLTGTLSVPNLSVDIVFMLATREPEILLPLIYESIQQEAKIRTATRLNIILHVFAGKDAAGRIPEHPSTTIDTVSMRVVNRNQRFSELKDQNIRDLVDDLPERTVYLCGPPGFEEASVKALTSVGVDAGKVIREAFNY